MGKFSRRAPPQPPKPTLVKKRIFQLENLWRWCRVGVFIDIWFTIYHLWFMIYDLWYTVFLYPIPKDRSRNGSRKASLNIMPLTNLRFFIEVGLAAYFFRIRLFNNIPPWKWTNVTWLGTISPPFFSISFRGRGPQGKGKDIFQKMPLKNAVIVQYPPGN